MSKARLIIDTDPGVDDAMAIIFAGLHPDIEIVGLTSVFGNVDVLKTTRNALQLLEMTGIDAPVAQGAAVPLVQVPNPVSDYVHGIEGFGDVPAKTPKTKPIEKSAAQFIVDTIHAHPNEITLCPIGPLTNIADALTLDPSIAAKVKEVVIMGGALIGGNVSEWAEANIWNDPHAADAVFAAPWKVVMVGLDVTSKVLCTNEDFAANAKLSPELGGFLAQAAEFYIGFYRREVGVDGCMLHDPAAIIACIRPDLFSVEKHKIEVIVKGSEIGRTKSVPVSDRPEAHICTGISGDAVKKLFLDVLGTGN